MSDNTVIVIGAGPVGMFAALSASLSGLPVILAERNTVRSENSRAIGITPPSLEILRPAGIDQKLISRGLKVRFSEAHSRRRRLGKISFTGLKSDYPYILTIPQNETEAVLEEAVRNTAGIRFLTGFSASSFIEENGGITAAGITAEGKTIEIHGGYLIACDGGKSAVRQALSIPFDGAPYRETFLMGDFDDTAGWNGQAHLYFTSRGSVESFPLPGGKRRYVLRTPVFIPEYTSDYLVKELSLRAGIDVRNARQYWESAFGTQHFLARSFCRGNVFLCGDAAHLMPPIGGQNMNTGFADAELAVWLIKKMSEGRFGLQKAGRFYNRVRRNAARSAKNRACMMMKLGTSGGFLWSSIRNAAVRVLLHTPLTRLLIGMFTMLSIPGRNLTACRPKLKKELGS